MSTVIWVVLALPFLWSAALCLLRRLTVRAAVTPRDRDEKTFLILLLVPVVFGIAGLALAQIFDFHLPVPLPLPLASGIDGAEVMMANAAMEPASFSLNLSAWPMIIWAVYAGVGAILAVRLLMAYVTIARTCARAKPDSTLGKGVRVSDDTDVALAWGADTVLLPQRLLPQLSEAQTNLIIRHERAHLDRRDPVYFAVLSWLDVVLWFNPFIRAQTRQCRLAAELDCDARVTGATPHMREAYVESLIKALKHAAGNARQCVPAAFSPAKSGDYRMRISEIMHPSPMRRKARLWIVIGGLMVAPVGMAQLAWSQAPIRTEAVATTATSPAMVFTVMPVEGRLSSGFGMRKNPVTGQMSVHEGVDIATPIGMSVRAPAGGVITRADEAEPWFGKVLDIDHGGGVVTRYKHLGDFKVKVGDRVSAGHEVAKSGNTGRTTGPHVHIGLFENGKAVDPAGRIPLPKAG